MAATLAWIVAAGALLPLQNLLLAAMVSRGLGSVTALAINSVVGVVLLAALNLALYGPAVLATAARNWQVWFVLPGVLGTCVVFAVLSGYTRLGATLPTICLIAGQLTASVLLDVGGFTGRRGEFPASYWAGVVLFTTGAVMVVGSRRG